MKKFMISLLTGLFIMSVSTLSLAGMLDDLKATAEETKQEASEAMKSEKADVEKAIEAKDASTKEEAGNMMDQAKDKVKETVNEKIDAIGK